MATKTNKLQFLSFFLVLFLFVGQLAIFQFSPNVKADPDWLSGWQYRKSHVIESASGAGTNYQIPIKIVCYAGNKEIVSDGIWCWFQDPRAIRYVGTYDKTYIGFVDSSGNIKIASYNHETEEINTFTLKSALQVDDHAAPAILIRNDGHIIVFYTSHYDNTMRWRISTNPEDITSFGSEYTFTGGKDTVCYPQPVMLSSESNKIYLFYRAAQSTGKDYWVYRTSTDGGETFGSEKELFRGFDRDCPYTKLVSNGADKIFFAVSDCDNHANPHEDVLYCYYYNGGFYKADGSLIKNESDLPITDKSTLDTVYDSSATGNYDAWVWDIALNSDGKPYIVFAVFPSTSDHRYRYARWTGSAWVNYEITSAGGYIDGSTEGYYSGGISLDHENPTHVFLSKKVNSGWQIQEWSTSDGGQTWSKVQDVSDSETKHCRPVCVRNYNSNFKVAFWSGTYNAMDDYDTNIESDLPPDDSGDTVYVNKKCRSDFGDIRFTKSDGTTLIDYWMEEKVDEDHALFWVEIPDDLSSSDVTIYIYYGKSDATTTSNGDNTFLFFDHFEGTQLDTDKWVVRQGDVSVENSQLKLTGTTETRGLIDGLTPISMGAALHVKAKGSGTTVSMCHFCSMRKSNDWNYRAGDLYGRSSDNKVAFETHNAGNKTDTLDITVNSLNSWHKYKITWKNGESKGYQDDTLLATHTTNIPTVNNVVVFYEGSVSGQDVYVDWCFVRKYVAPEPSHGSWGTEEEETQEYSHTFTETLSPSTILNQWQEQFRIWIESVYPSATMSLWREVSYTYTQTVTATETVTYLQEYIQIMQESLSTTETIEHAGEGVFTFIQTITPSETVTYLQEQQYVLTEIVASTGTFEHWIEGINVFTETFTETLQQTATVHYWIEMSHTLTETFSPQTLLEAVGEIIYVLTETIDGTVQHEIAQELLQTMFETLKPTTVFNYAKELVETFIVNFETMHVQAILYKRLYTPTAEINLALVLAAFAAAIAIVALSLTITKKE